MRQNTESGDGSETKSKYPMLQAYWPMSTYVVNDHCQAKASKIDRGHSDNSDDTHGSGEGSQTAQDDEWSYNLHHVMSNETG